MKEKRNEFIYQAFSFVSTRTSKLVTGTMKIINAMSDTPGMTKEEVERFLESESILQIATLDRKGEPNIQPVCFYYDKDGEKLLVTTSKLAKKTQNLRDKPIIYFSIDNENVPYKGVKGKGIARIVEEPDKIVPQADRISMKYLGRLDHPVAEMRRDHSKKGDVVLVEIIVNFFSTRDYGKGRRTRKRTRGRYAGE